MLTNAFDMVKQQRKLERKHHALILVGVLLSIVLVFLGDTMGWMGMFFVVAPCLCVALSISLVIYGIWRKQNHLTCARTFTCAAVLILFPVALIAFFFLAGILGLGPLPS